jgi:heat shock protein HslJ
MKRFIPIISLCIGLVVLAACNRSGSKQGSGGNLTGKVWAVTELAGKSILQNTGITAQFGSDGTLSGLAGCNQYNGKYTVSGNSITISTPLATTMMACPQPVMDQESAYLKALGEAKTYTVKGNQLTLNDSGGKAIASYKAQSQDLAGSSWLVIGYNNGKQAVVSVTIGTELTANFGKDGNLTGNAGCNNYNGPYKVDGDKITIGPLASTQMFCNDPAGVMDQEAQYLAALQTAATYKIEGNALELRTSDGALAADFNTK